MTSASHSANRHNVPPEPEQIFPAIRNINRIGPRSFEETAYKSIRYIVMRDWPAVCSAMDESMRKVLQ